MNKKGDEIPTIAVMPDWFCAYLEDIIPMRAAELVTFLKATPTEIVKTMRDVVEPRVPLMTRIDQKLKEEFNKAKTEVETPYLCGEGKRYLEGKRDAYEEALRIISKELQR